MRKISLECGVEKMKRRGKATVFAFLGLVLTAIFWGGYRFAQTRRSEVGLTPTPTLSLSPTSVVSPLPTISPTPTPSVNLKKIDVLSTEGWKTVYQNGVSFKIPPDAVCKTDSREVEENTQDCRLIYFTSEVAVPIQISVSEYAGGSRRKQFFGDHYRDCHWIYEEALFGKIKALQIAGDGGWCQGGVGGIVAVVGSKLVVFHGLTYNPETGVIARFPIRDTVVSTLRAE